jgi:hypothetical protein
MASSVNHASIAARFALIGIEAMDPDADGVVANMEL